MSRRKAEKYNKAKKYKRGIEVNNVMFSDKSKAAVIFNIKCWSAEDNVEQGWVMID